ncbi:hypothetical protein PR048_019651 [Dryococelus australis]|uniref:Nucleolar complex protein 2 homolog n=1 Tax=Dryococelus australis TaxID=614101 RepID=A0ABQ9H418_9NEOP|nr:hypothetical protein PR048_019651 [Dryococelus australis]
MAVKKKEKLTSMNGKLPKLKKKNKKETSKKYKHVYEEHMGSMNVDEFFSTGIVDSDDSNDDGDVANINGKDVKNENSSSYEEGGDNMHVLESDGDTGFSESKLHKESLAKLQSTDPEFYSFLRANDKKLLQFELSDSESDVHERASEDVNIHQLPDMLEVASDDSENEATDYGSSEHNITLKMVKSWHENLQTDKTAGTIRIVIKAFHAALQRVTVEDDEEPAEFKVDDSSVFNAVVQLCVLDLQPAIKRFLRILGTVGHVQPSKCKRWVKIKVVLKMYLGDLLQLLGSVSSPHILTVLLKHLHQMIPFLLFFTNISKLYLKKLIQLWSSGEETVRVVAFLCILRFSTSRQADLLQSVLKKMYIAYVNNCKFVSPNTLSGINFMRHSLVEIYALDESASYQHVFLYVRQLAINLRNAITVQKKEHHQAVYSWQFVHSLYLWVELLCATSNKLQLQPLLYPLVQIIIGTLKLIPIAYYYPLRFHCVQMLIQLSKSSVFVPVLPFLLEVLNSYDFNKRHKKVSMKPLDLTCMLRVSKSQIHENGFKDAVIEKIYQQILEYLACEAHCISFPDMVVPAVIQIKKFIKTCKVSNYTKKLKQLLDKIEENSRFVENERHKITFSLTERKVIDAWEATLREKGVPLLTYYNSWHKLHLQQVAKRVTENDKLGEFNIPVLKKFQKKRTMEPESSRPVELFPSDDSEDDILDAPMTSVEKIKKNNKKKEQREMKHVEFDIKTEADELAEDIIEEFTLSDLD